MQIVYSTWPPRSSRAGRPSMVQYKWSDALGKCSPGYPRFHSEELFITASRFPPHSSLIIHHSSFIIHHSSFIIHHSSLITHHSSSRSDRTKRSYLSLLLAPRSPLPGPPSSVLSPDPLRSLIFAASIGVSIAASGCRFARLNHLFYNIVAL